MKRRFGVLFIGSIGLVLFGSGACDTSPTKGESTKTSGGGDQGTAGAGGGQGGPNIAEPCLADELDGARTGTATQHSDPNALQTMKATFTNGDLVDLAGRACVRIENDNNVETKKSSGCSGWQGHRLASHLLGGTLNP